MKKACLIICLALVFASASQAGIQDADEYLLKNVVVKKLPNGITVVMLNRGYSQTVATQIEFRVGSADESYDTAGAAHMLEHMLFKGTDRIGTKDFKKEKEILDRVEAVGETIDRLKASNPQNKLISKLEAELKELQKLQSAYIVSSPYDKIYSESGGVGFNASTSKDQTGYYIELPSSRLELWAELESERLRNPVLREYYQERNNVIEERMMRYDSDGTGLLFEQFLAASFTTHPYRHPVIGWKTNIPFLSLKKIREFYNTYYIPSRMVITVVGKQDTEETFRIINNYFGKIKNRPEPSELTTFEPVQKGERRIVLNFEANPYIIAGWHKPTFPSRDDYIFDVIGEVLTGGRSSRLYKKLILEKKIASSVNSWASAPGSRYDNMFILFASPRAPHTTAEVESEIYSEISRMISDISDDEIKKVINKLESQSVFSLDSNKGMARLLSSNQTLFGDWRYAVSYMKVLRGITADDVKKAAIKYLRDENRTVAVLADTRKMEK